MNRQRPRPAARPGPRRLPRGWVVPALVATLMLLMAAAVAIRVSSFGAATDVYSGQIHRFHPRLPAALPDDTALPATVRRARTLDELLALPPGKLADVDIAESNLLCAIGLPGAEGLDIDRCLATLDQWAARVAFETHRHFYRLTDPRYAQEYHHSEAYMRTSMLLQVLEQDLGVKYNMAAKDDFSFKDSSVAFLHGMIPAAGRTVADTPGGTCSSMPVMFVAVGRRLGYPLRLVTAKAHVFARWDGLDHANPAWRERFNIEGTGGYFDSYPDDHYKTWPFPVTDAEVKANGWLQSLTAAEELAMFLASRGHSGLDNGQPAFAARCYENAYRYDPGRPCYRHWFLEAAAKCNYKPGTPALARLLAEKMRPGALAGPEQISAEQEAEARRRWLGGQRGSVRVPGLPENLPLDGPPRPAGPSPYPVPMPLTPSRP